jgi:hypothetical protein
LNLPAGPGCQRPRATESVSADSVRPIRTEIDGGEPSSPSHRGLDETLALATGGKRGEAHQGASRVAAGWRRSLRSLLRVRSLQKEVLGGRAHPRGPRVPSKMATSSRCQRGKEVRGEVPI